MIIDRLLEQILFLLRSSQANQYHYHIFPSFNKTTNGFSVPFGFSQANNLTGNKISKKRDK